MHKSFGLVVASLVATLLLSLWSVSYRYKVEAANKAVGLLMEGQVLNDLASSSSKGLPIVLAELKAHGLIGVALTEENVGDLIDQGQVSLDRRLGGGFTVRGDPATLSRVARGISRRGGLAASPGVLKLGALDYDGDVKALRNTSVGLNPFDALCAQQAGLDIVARHANVLGAGPAYIQDILEESRSLGAKAFLAAGEQVLGQRGSVEDLTSSLQTLDMEYLTPEFAKIAGDGSVAALIPERTIRLHSMQQAEVDKTTPASIIDRYKLAFRERNMRWLLIRPFTFGGPDAVASMATALDSLKAGLASEGGVLKSPRPYTEPGVPRFLFPLIALSAVPWVHFALKRFFKPGMWHFVLAAGLTLLAAGAWVEGLRPLAALAIGVAGPVAGYEVWLKSRDSWSVVASFLLISLVSLTAGLAIAGLLNSLPYVIQVKQALGIKAILIAPVALVGWMLLTEFWSPRDLMAGSVTWGQALLALGVAGAVLFLLMRSGNDSPGAVSDVELRFRALLDRVLYTRPRTKEILLGHPALLLGLLAYKRSKSSARVLVLSVVLLTLGAVGQSDIVDTLCHTHTPIDIGLARVALGLVIGGIIGALAWVPVRSIVRKFEGI